MKKSDIAIIGMSCIFPGAKDIQTFWENIINRVDATQQVPADRIDPVHFDKNLGALIVFTAIVVGLSPIISSIRSALAFYH
ncbi:beta-ketoacyl synthase N-terminal-like domain-containing protein [Pedobacter sp. HDW13]|uniref:beta-ketoacyl synthase N-terminal-like domain-containing protein n=1 Tax=Pedobacter sp. HDW13 TaxID=2714940 RepID=UPI00197E2D5A|nr:beta-ketoacyl synthase N-terminal-like domain-containing protein [Pedobacter sp. HDW13]